MRNAETVLNVTNNGMTTGEPDALKGASPVRRGAEGKVLRIIGATRRQPTLHSFPGAEGLGVVAVQVEVGVEEGHGGHLLSGCAGAAGPGTAAGRPPSAPFLRLPAPPGRPGVPRSPREMPPEASGSP